MAEKEIRGILKQSEKKKRNGEFLYSPGCNKDLLIFCINKQDCEYYQKNFKIKGKREPNYLGQCWQYVLTSREREILFYVLPRILCLTRDYATLSLALGFKSWSSLAFVLKYVKTTYLLLPRASASLLVVCRQAYLV